MPTKIEYTKEFRDDIKKIRDKKVKNRIKKIIQKIVDDLGLGKPLKYELKGLRSVKLPPFRIIYEYKDNTVILLKFEHREKVYNKI
jgi:addiction module RelE/StbE family toxin